MSTIPKKILVKDVMLEINNFPIVNENELIKETLDSMNFYTLGMACIINKSNKLIGVITDGDIRRTLLNSQKPLSALFVDDALDHSTTDFKSVLGSSTLIEAVQMMGEFRIWELPVVDIEGKLQGLLHLHPAISALLNE